jgi:hypothetical protein
MAVVEEEVLVLLGYKTMELPIMVAMEVLA